MFVGLLQPPKAELPFALAVSVPAAVLDEKLMPVHEPLTVCGVVVATLLPPQVVGTVTVP